MEQEVMKWKEISREEVFSKYGRKIEKVIYKFPNGNKSDYYIKSEGPYTCTFGITEDNKVILAEQFRPGPNKILLELPGGVMEKGEESIVSAKREFLEETGYDGNFQFIGMAYDDAYNTLYRHCFVATDCKKIKEIKNSEDGSEVTNVKLLTLEEFRKLLRSGSMTDIEVGYLGLDFLNLL